MGKGTKWDEPEKMFSDADASQKSAEIELLFLGEYIFLNGVFQGCKSHSLPQRFP